MAMTTRMNHSTHRVTAQLPRNPHDEPFHSDGLQHVMTLLSRSGLLPMCAFSCARGQRIHDLFDLARNGHRSIRLHRPSTLSADYLNNPTGTDLVPFPMNRACGKCLRFPRPWRTCPLPSSENIHAEWSPVLIEILSPLSRANAC